ncbi:hypothetical protein QBC35DRAFT_248408 [Podospora australis]|uniref:Uncharacterized protein n=1 Tax=Podospora australis TaxID=1536484 RepID=A0AAN7AMB0_9PEZI|nr:hypothetical protein QBC35DRAFT_248408 [Podospora australis]
MTALHHSWLSSTTNALAKSYPDMEETYIYHKIEAIRLVNEQITNPNMCTSDDCLSLIAGLALAESGMGNCVAAEAHLNGLSTLIDMKRPEEWQHRFYGMLQRIILMAGSFIAASKTPSGDNSDYDSPLIPDYSKTPSPLFSTARFAATRLSPFYLSSTPCLEACKADVEGEVLINALRRLTSTCFSSTSPFSAPSPTSSPRSSYSASPAADSRVITSVLLSDTEAYIASLLFKPDHFETSLSSPPSSPPSSSSPRVSSRKKRKRQFRTRDDHPYQNLPAELFPCSSRAWATAAYLYLHVVLAPLWDNHDAPSTPSSATAIPKRHKIDPHLLRFLFDTLKEDTAATEEAALRIGAYSSELWVWKVMLGAYVAEITEQKDVYTDLISKDYCSAAASFRASATESEHRQDPDSSIGSVGDDDGDDDSDSDDDDGQEKKESNYLEEMRSFFKTKLASWSRCPQSKGTSEWSVAKQMLERIVWVPSSFSSRDDNDTHKMSFEAIIEKLWWEAVYCSPQAPRYQQEQQQQVVEEEDHHYIMATETMRRTSSPLVPVDPALR